jgi:hypothetical protein
MLGATRRLNDDTGEKQFSGVLVPFIKEIDQVGHMDVSVARDDSGVAQWLGSPYLLH